MNYRCAWTVSLISISRRRCSVGVEGSAITLLPGHYCRLLLPAIVWLASIAAGGFSIYTYETSPGRQLEAPGDWPQSSAIARSRERPTMLVFVHPRCPCTRATIDELSRIVVENPQALYVKVLYYKPADADSAWDET